MLQEEIDKLNTSQKEAVNTTEGPVMVVAGPGTGKTQIIGLRTANIIQTKGVKPEDILITTFTDAGVVAIKERLTRFLGNDGYKVNVSTIHSFCQDVITTFPEKFLEYKASSPIDDVDSIEIIKEILDKLISEKRIVELTNDYDRYLYLRDIKSRISNLKQEGISKDEFDSAVQNQEHIYSEELAEIKPTLKKYETTKEAQIKHINKLRELSILYTEYNKYLRDNSKYDFNDMINFVLEKMGSDSFLSSYYSEKYSYIMLDEFQDTNNAQNKIVDIILKDKEVPNIMVVGDDDQSIYRFQGANIENMLDFSTKYQNTKVVVLENNYRSTQPILDLCSNLIDNNVERLSKRLSIDKKLISSNIKYSSIGDKAKLVMLNTPEEEKSFLLKTVKEKIDTGVDINEIAIIVRNNKEVEELSNYFTQNSIDVNSKLNTDIFKNSYVSFLLKFINVLNNPNSNENDFIDVLRNPILGINQIDLFKINKYLYNLNYTKKYKKSLFDFILEIENNSESLGLNDIDLILGFRDKFTALTQSLKNMNISEFVHYLLQELDLVNFINNNGCFGDIEDIYTFLNKVKYYVNIDKRFNIEKLLNKVQLYSEYNYSIQRQILKKKKAGINIMTAHGSKGLEYEVVLIPGLYYGNWDNKRVIDKLKLPTGLIGNAIQKEFNPMEEERRLFFVACSRAKKELYLSYPISDGSKVKLASSFIVEIENIVEKNDNVEVSPTLENGVINFLSNKDIFTYKDNEFEYIEKFLEDYKLSPTDLNTFIEDPMLFLNQVVFKYPFLDNDATIFGKVYHRTLELFYTRYKETQKIDDLSYLTFTFEKLLEKELLTPESFEKLLEKGKEGLKGYYDTYKYNILTPLFLEYNLRPKNILHNNIPLTGKIDKIEILNDEVNGKTKVNVVDYKTGSVKTIGTIKGLDRYGNKKTDGEGKYFRQLMFYKLLLSNDIEFSSKFEINSLLLDFVEGKDGEYKQVNVEYTIEEYADFLKELEDNWIKMKDINFWKNLLLSK